MADIRAGDHSRFREVFEQYHQRLYFFILHKTDSPYLSEEVMQLSFIKLWESRHTLKDDYTISTQLFRIATTVLIDQLRKVQTQPRLTAVTTQSLESPADDSSSKNIEQKELQERIAEAMHNLPPVRRQVFEMSRELGMSYQEIADNLSVSVKTVETHMSKALKQLRKYLNLIIFLFSKLFFE